MRASLLLFFVLTLISEILGTVGGFGSSLFFVSVAQFFYPFNAVLALTGLLHMFSNSAKLVFFLAHYLQEAVAVAGRIQCRFFGCGGAVAKVGAAGLRTASVRRVPNRF